MSYYSGRGSYGGPRVPYGSGVGVRPSGGSGGGAFGLIPLLASAGYRTSSPRAARGGRGGGNWRSPVPSGASRSEPVPKSSAELSSDAKEVANDEKGRSHNSSSKSQEGVSKDVEVPPAVASAHAPAAGPAQSTSDSTPSTSAVPTSITANAGVSSTVDDQQLPDKQLETKPDGSILQKPDVKVEIKPEEPDYPVGDSTRITIDTYNSDLHLETEADGLTCGITRGPGFEYMWGGGRATHGVSKGKVCFEVHVLEEQRVILPLEEVNPYVARVGWSVDGSDYQLGEAKLSWGYGGTAKISCEGKFRDYGRPFGAGDVITCYIDLDATPKAIFFMRNGQYLGVAFRMTNELDGKAVYPHVTLKNMRCRLNFGEDPPKFPVTLGFTMMQRVPPEALTKPVAGPVKREEAEIIMMVGLPACGKSYWADKFCADNPEKKYYVLGTNAIMDKMRVMGLVRRRNYHGRWDELIDRATKVLNKLFEGAEYRVKNYILDQTNVYFTARRRKMDAFRGYKRIAAVIVNEPTVLAQRTEMQQKVEGKMVPVDAVMEMQRNFTLPEIGPSFDEVRFIEEKLPRAQVLVEQYRSEGEEFKRTGLKRPVSTAGSLDDAKKSKLGEDHVEAGAFSPRGAASGSRFNSPRLSGPDSRGSPAMRGLSPLSLRNAASSPRGPSGLASGPRSGAPSPSEIPASSRTPATPATPASASVQRPDSQTSGSVPASIEDTRAPADSEPGSGSNDALRGKSQGILGAAPDTGTRGLLGSGPGDSAGSSISSSGRAVGLSDPKGPAKVEHEPSVDADRSARLGAKDKLDGRDRSYDRTRTDQKSRPGDKVSDDRGRSHDRSRHEDRGGRSADRRSDSKSGRGDDRRTDDRGRAHDRSRHEERSRLPERPRTDERSRGGVRERDDRGRPGARSRSRDRGRLDERKDGADGIRSDDRFGRDRNSWARSREYAASGERVEDGRTLETGRARVGGTNRDLGEEYGDFRPAGFDARRVDQSRESWYRNDVVSETRVKPDPMSDPLGVAARANVDRFPSRKPTRWGPEQPLGSTQPSPAIGSLERQTPDGRFPQGGRRDDPVPSPREQIGGGYAGDYATRYGDEREPVRYPDIQRAGPYRAPDVAVKEELHEGGGSRAYGVGYGRNPYSPAASSLLPVKEELPWKVDKSYGRGDYSEPMKDEPSRDSLYSSRDPRGAYEQPQYESRGYRQGGDSIDQRGYASSEIGARDPRYAGKVDSAYSGVGARDAVPVAGRDSANSSRDVYDPRRLPDYTDRGYDAPRYDADRSYDRYQLERLDEKPDPTKASYDSYSQSVNRPGLQTTFFRPAQGVADDKRTGVVGSSFAGERYETIGRSQLPDYSGYSRDLSEQPSGYGASARARDPLGKLPVESYGADQTALRSYQQPKAVAEDASLASKMYSDYGSRQDYRAPALPAAAGSDAYDSRDHYGSQPSAYGSSRPAVNPTGTTASKTYADYGGQQALQSAVSGSYSAARGRPENATPSYAASAYGQQSAATSHQSHSYYGNTTTTTGYASGYSSAAPAYARGQSDSQYGSSAGSGVASKPSSGSSYESSSYGQYGSHQGYSSYSSSNYGSAPAAASSTASAPGSLSTQLPMQPASSSVSGQQAVSVAATASATPAAIVSQTGADGTKSYEQQQQDYQKAYSQWYANYARAFAQLQAQQQPQ